MNSITHFLYLISVRALCWFTRTVQRFPSRWRIVIWLREHSTILAECRPISIMTAFGFRMNVDPKDFVSRHIIVNGTYEEMCGILIRDILEADSCKNTCMIDVGANIGYFTLLASHVLGSDGVVHAFEASPHIYAQLEKNVLLNSSSNVVMHRQAVTDKCGHIMFSTASCDHLGLSTIRDIGTLACSKDVVETVDLDSLYRQMPRVSLVKIDVEGAEYLVVNGMQGLLRQHHPYVIMELSDSFLREVCGNAKELCSLLRESGYSLHEVVWDGIVPLSEPIPEQCNVLCIPPQGHIPSFAKRM